MTIIDSMSITKEAKEPRCITKKGAETNGAGYRAEVSVKHKLWRYGYRVKHMDSISPFDLLVDGKWRVEVKTGKLRIGRSGVASWNIMIPYRPNLYDILAVVLPLGLKRPAVLFFTHDEEGRIFEVRGKRLYAATFTEGSERMKIGAKSPFSVFGKPPKLIHSLVA